MRGTAAPVASTASNCRDSGFQDDGGADDARRRMI
jgi:hypothetical protein